jgi:Spy/CpxP family protein refolding chaperone
VNVWKVILVTMVIFATGAITGGLVVRKTSSESAAEPGRPSATNRLHQAFRPERMLRMDFIDRAQQELALTPEQMQQIEVILSESQARTREIWEEFSPQMRAEVKSTQQKIRDLLTPEQRGQFEELMKRRRAPRRADWERRGPEHEATPGTPPAPAE